jgi:two-component system nitrate/nitrite sensor histidine kinase NarX
MLSSVRDRLILLLLGFLLLVTGSVIATEVGLQTAAQDALVINLAGRQRMLLQAMTRHALEAEKHPEEQHHRDEVSEAAATFEATLTALTDGGPAPYTPARTVLLPPAQGPEVRARLEEVRRRWTRLRPEMETVLTASQDDPAFARAVTAMEQQSLPLVATMDEAVQAFEQVATDKVRRLRVMQALFLTGALILVLLGYGFTSRTIIRPLRRLQQVAHEIGGGELAKPVPGQGRGEVGQLAQSLETMRQQLYAAREDLEAQVARRTRELEALYKVSREVSSRLDINHVLRSVTDKARELLGAEVAILCLLDEAGQSLDPQAVSGPSAALSGTRESAQHLPASQVLAGNRALPCGVDGCGGTCAILAAPFRVDHLAAPLRVGDRVIGALCVGSPQAGAFSAEEVGLLTRLANSAAVALENARLYEQAERVATLEERQRIAAEMHDGVAQTLSYLGLKTEQAAELVDAGSGEMAVEVLQRMRGAIDQASQDVRRSIVSLQEGPQPHRALQDSLAEVVNEFATDGGPRVDLVLSLEPPLVLASDDTDQVLRVVREALLNARRHAQAEHITVCLEKRGAEAIVTVEDNGRGFNPEAPSVDGNSHFGLRIMRARAARIGGRVAIDSSPGHGTRVSLMWPVGVGKFTQPEPALETRAPAERVGTAPTT